MNNNEGAISFDAILRNSQFLASFQEMEKRIIGFTNTATKETQKVDDSFARLGKTIATYITVDALKNVGQELIKVRGEFQALEISLRVMLGSKAKADALMAQVTEFAAKTPFTLSQVGSASKQLLAYGFSAESLIEQLKMLGDVAAGVSAPVNDLVYLYGTLRTQGIAHTVDIQQFAGRGIPIYRELAKVLNVAESNVKAMVEAGKVGFPEVEQAFKNLTKAGGMFAGMMDEQSKSINGLMSNLGDAVDKVFNEIGKNQEGFITGSVKMSIELVENYKKIIDILEVVAVTYGAYKAAILLANAVESASIAIKGGWTIATLAQYRALLLAEGAQKLLNATMLANPYVAVATLVVGLASAVYLLSTNTAIAERAQNKFNKEQEDFANKINKIKAETSSLSNTVRDNTSSQQQQEKAYHKLQELYPDLLKNISLHQFKTIEATKAQRDFNAALDEMSMANLKAQLSIIDAQITNTQRSLSSLRTTPQLGVSGGNTSQYVTLTRSLEEQKALRKEYVEQINNNRRAERKATKEQEEEQDKNIIKNKKYYQDKISQLELEQQKYDVGSKKYIEYQKQIDAINEKLNPKKGNSKSFEVTAPMGSIAYWEQVAAKAKQVAENTANPAVISQQNAIIFNANRKAEEMRKLMIEKSFEDEIEEKKKQYKLYEQWVAFVSKDAADAQFKDLILKGKSYADFLKNQKALLEAQQSAGVLDKKGENALISVNVEYQNVTQGKSSVDILREKMVVAKNEAKTLVEYLEKLKALQAETTGDTSSEGIEKNIELQSQIAETKNQIAENLKEFLSNVETYENQILRVQKKYSALRFALDEQYKDKTNVEYLRQKEIVDSEEKKELKGIEENRAENLASFKKLQYTLYENNYQGLKNRLRDEKEHLADLQNSRLENTEQYKKQLKEIAKTERELHEALLSTISKFAGLAGSLGGVMAQMNGAIGETGQLLSGVAKNADAVIASFKKGATTADLVANGIQGLIGLTDMLVSSANQRNKAEQEYYQNALQFEQDYKVAINERIGLMSQSNENVFVKNYTGRFGDSFKMFNDASEKYKQALEKLNEGQAKTGQRNALSWGNIGAGVGSGAAVGAAVGSIVPGIGTAIGAGVGAIVGGLAGLFGGKKKEDEYTNLLKEYPELIQTASNGQKVFNKDLAETLIKNNQVSDATKQLLQSTIDWTNQMEKAKEQVKTLITELAGNLGNNLRDGLVNAFKEGTSAAEAFGKSVSAILEDMLSQLIFNQVFSKAFDDLQAEMIKSADILNGGDNNFIDDFGKFFANADGLWKQFYDQLDAASKAASNYGIDIFKKSTSSSSTTPTDPLKGAIQGVTEEKIDALAGNMTQLRIVSTNQLIVMRNVENIANKQLQIQTQYLPYLERIDRNLDKLNSADSVLRSKGIDG